MSWNACESRPQEFEWRQGEWAEQLGLWEAERSAWDTEHARESEAVRREVPPAAATATHNVPRGLCLWASARG